MNMQWTKALADLRAHPAKTCLLWIAIFVGALTVMAAFGSRRVLEREIDTSFMGSAPAAVMVWTDDVDASLRSSISNLKHVSGVDARRLVRARVDVGEGQWRSLLLYGVDDVKDMHASKVYPVEGMWPPPEGSIMVEQSATPVVKSQVGKPLRVRLPGDVSTRAIPVTGVTHDPARAPGWQDKLGYAYATRQTFSMLGLGAQLDELHIAVEGDRHRAQDVAAQVSALMSKMKRPVHRIEVPPRQHPHADHMQAMLLLLQVLAVLSLLLSALLAINLFASMLARHTRQIGVMKTLGASSWKITRIYLISVGVLSVSASVMGSLAGVMVSRQFTDFASQQLNLYAPRLDVPWPMTLGVMIVAASLPLCASLLPIRRTTSIPVREAIQDVGIEWSGSLSDAHRAARLPVMVRFSLRNSLRRRTRFVLTIISFAVGGAMLMTAVNVYQSLIEAVDDSLGTRKDAIEIRFLRPAPTEKVRDRISQLEGVRHVVPWGAVLAGFALPSKTEPMTVAGRYGLLAPPEGTLPLSARLVEGTRSLGEEPSRVELIVNRQLLALEPHLEVGARTTLIVGHRQSSAIVVGVVEEVAPASAYVTPESMSQVLGASGVSGGVRIELEEDLNAIQLTTQIEDILVREGWFPVYFMTRDELRDAMVDHFMILLMVLMALAWAAVLVGILGLATTMSINVLERQREIGVIKALGASSWRVRGLVLLEGVITTATSLVLALVLSVPLSIFVGLIAGSKGLHVSLPYHTSGQAIFGWILLAMVATLIACLGPAEQAARRPVRHLIAYE